MASNPAAITSFASVAALRSVPAVAGLQYQNIYLEAYTSGTGKGGGALFWNSTSAVNDNGVTIFKPNDGGATGRWYRQSTPTGGIPQSWGGAVEDGVTDDSTAVQRVYNLFSANAGTGTILVEGKTALARPVYYFGFPGQGLAVQGNVGLSRGLNGAGYKWIGTGYPFMIACYAANETIFDGVCFDSGTSLGTDLLANIAFIAANTGSAVPVLTAPVVAGISVTASISTTANLIAGRIVPVGAAGSSNFEMVLISNVGGGTFTATFMNNHATSEPVGGGAGSSGCGVRNSSSSSPSQMTATTLSAPLTAGSNVVITPVSMTGIKAGFPVAIGGLTPLIRRETVYVKSITASTFTADVGFNHAAGERVLVATASILIGNITSAGDVQVSETEVSGVQISSIAGSSLPGNSYAGIRYIGTGNVKNHIVNSPTISFQDYYIALESSSGNVRLRHCIGSNAQCADFLLNGTANIELVGFETEDQNAAGCRFVVGGTSGTGSIRITGGQWVGIAPPDDFIIQTNGSVYLFGNSFNNGRTGSSVPLIQSVELYTPGISNPGSLTSIANWYENATNFTPIFYQAGSTNAINYGSYPIDIGVPNLFSLFDYSQNGNLQPVIGQLAFMGVGPTIDTATAGITFSSLANAVDTGTRTSPITFTQFQTGATSIVLRLCGLPAKTRILSVTLDVTAAFSGTAGTLLMKAGTTSGGNDLLLATDVKTAPIVVGAVSGDLGAGLATPIQGGYIPSWSGDTGIYITLTSSSGNLSGLTVGSVTPRFKIERIP